MDQATIMTRPTLSQISALIDSHGTSDPNGVPDCGIAQHDRNVAEEFAMIGRYLSKQRIELIREELRYAGLLEHSHSLWQDLCDLEDGLDTTYAIISGIRAAMLQKTVSRDLPKYRVMDEVSQQDCGHIHDLRRTAEGCAKRLNKGRGWRRWGIHDTRCHALILGASKPCTCDMLV